MVPRCTTTRPSLARVHGAKVHDNQAMDGLPGVTVVPRCTATRPPALQRGGSKGGARTAAADDPPNVGRAVPPHRSKTDNGSRPCEDRPGTDGNGLWLPSLALLVLGPLASTPGEGRRAVAHVGVRCCSPTDGIRAADRTKLIDGMSEAGAIRPQPR